MASDIYKCKNFRDLIKEKLAEFPERGYRASLSKAAGCQPAYLSQALQGRANFTTEQVFRMCSFWKLGTQETDFAMLLFQADRTDDSLLRNFFLEKTDVIRKKNMVLARQIGATSMQALPITEMAHYYSSWHYAAIHVMISIPLLNSESALAFRMNLSISRVQQVVDDLIRFGIIKRSSKGLEVLRWNIHIDEFNPLHITNHINWRIQCSSQLQMSSQSRANELSGGKDKVSNLHYSAVHTLSRKDWVKLREMVVTFIKEARGIVSNSPEEETIAMLIDLYTL